MHDFLQYAADNSTTRIRGYIAMASSTSSIPIPHAVEPLHTTPYSISAAGGGVSPSPGVAEASRHDSRLRFSYSKSVTRCLSDGNVSTM